MLVILRKKKKKKDLRSPQVGPRHLSISGSEPYSRIEKNNFFFFYPGIQSALLGRVENEVRKQTSLDKG